MLSVRPRFCHLASLAFALLFGFQHAQAQAAITFTPSAGGFTLAQQGRAASLLVEPQAPETLRVAANAFAGDLARVTGASPRLIAAPAPTPGVVLIAVVGSSPLLDQLQKAHKLDTSAVAGQWESSLVAVVDHPFAGVGRALVIAGSDRRGAAFALFTLSRQMGVSPWNWWADVPVKHHARLFVTSGTAVQGPPSITYRGIFLNDEDWGLRPWAAARMDPGLHNIGPRTYERVFELLLRLRANTLWPAMHPGTLPFNAVPENARLADRWGIVMGSSHSEALLRNNVGEWDRKRDGDWNYQTNKPAIDAYWDQRVKENGRFENLYTVGMRGQHDSGLEATGSNEVKARLVESAIATQRSILAKYIQPDITGVPQVLWLYKESLELYRAGMRVPDDVTLGWTDDNYGYLRQLPNPEEQRRSGGSGVYYHVSYWGFPHDYLWLCSTPPALIREELTKAYEQHARRFWMLNVGDLKPAEIDIDYFMRLAWDEPGTAGLDQQAFLTDWFQEQLPAQYATRAAALLAQYYQLNFVRKPEFMGFNGYDDNVKHTSFNPRGPVDQNRQREAAWQRLSAQAQALGAEMPRAYRDAYFELVGYPVEAAAAQNTKFLAADRAWLDRSQGVPDRADAARSRAAFEQVQALTARYNAAAGGKWSGMMSASPRERHVFDMPPLPGPGDAAQPLPAEWSSGDAPLFSAGAAQFSRSSGNWQTLSQLGISGTSMRSVAGGEWLDYTFTSPRISGAKAQLDILPTFPLYPGGAGIKVTVSLDGLPPIALDAAGTGEWKEGQAPVWEKNVLRNFARLAVPLPDLTAGNHTLRITGVSPGVVVEHLSVIDSRTAPGYPTP